MLSCPILTATDLTVSRPLRCVERINGMKHSFPNTGGCHGRAAFTLVELVVSAGLIGIVGGLVFSIFTAEQVLFGKNLATNVPSQSSRMAFDHVSRDMHLN